MKSSYLTISAASFSALVFFSQASHADILLNETFSYDGGTTITSTGNWVAFSGGGTLPVTENSSGAVTTTNVGSGVSGEDDRDTFTATAITSGSLYYSALVAVTAFSSATPSANGDYFLSPYNSAPSGGGYAGRIFVSGTTDGGIAFGLSNSGSAPTDGPDITIGTYYKLILKYDFSTKTASLGIFDPSFVPTDDSGLTITGGTASAIAALDSVAIRQGSSTNAAFTTAIDGIEVGTTLADVASIQLTPAPEPSAVGLLIGGLVSLVGFQRIRRRTLGAGVV